MGQRRGPLGAQGIEERVHTRLITPCPGPDQAATVVVDDHHQVTVPAPVGDLIDPDPGQPVQTVTTGSSRQLRGHPRHHRPDRPPRTPQQRRRRRPRHLRGTPGHLLLERVGVSRRRRSPRDHRGDHPVLGAAHPHRTSHHEHPPQPGIHRPPPPQRAMVIPRTPPTTPRTPIMTTDLGPDLDHHHRLHPPTPSRGPLLLPTGHHLHRPRIDPQQTSHYPATEHAVTT